MESNVGEEPGTEVTIEEVDDTDKDVVNEAAIELAHSVGDAVEG